MCNRMSILSRSDGSFLGVVEGRCRERGVGRTNVDITRRQRRLNGWQVAENVGRRLNDREHCEQRKDLVNREEVVRGTKIVEDIHDGVITKTKGSGALSYAYEYIHATRTHARAKVGTLASLASLTPEHLPYHVTTRHPAVASLFIAYSLRKSQ